jgi:hypothetical protein
VGAKEGDSHVPIRCDGGRDSEWVGLGNHSEEGEARRESLILDIAIIYRDSHAPIRREGGLVSEWAGSEFVLTLAIADVTLA